MVQLDTNPSLTRDSSRVTVTRTAKYTVEQRDKKQRRTEQILRFLPVVLPVVLLLLWEAGVALNRIDARFYPPPSVIALHFVDIGGNILLSEVSTTLFRLSIGLLLGATSGLLFGVAMGSSYLLRKTCEPLLSALYVVPKLVLLPIFLTLFGIGNLPIISLSALAVFFYVWIGVMEAIASAHAGYRDAAISFGASKTQMFQHVTLPSIVSPLFVALRVGSAIALLLTMAGEFIIGRDGLGQLIFGSRSLFKLDTMFVGIITVAVLGVLIQSLVTFIGRLVTPWERRGRSL